MKLYTSYFYQIRNFPRNLIPLSTVVWPPKYPIKDSTGKPALIIDCPPLKPGSECAGLCNGSCNPPHPQDCKFLQTYRKQLEAINVDEFIAQLIVLKERIEEGEHLEDVNFALIVFEAPSRACSERGELQNWLRAHGVEIEEWSKNDD